MGANPYVSRAAFGPRLETQPMAANATALEAGDIVAWDDANARWDRADAGSTTDFIYRPLYVLISSQPTNAANGDTWGTLAKGCVIDDTDAPFTRNGALYLRDVTNSGTAVGTNSLQATRPTTAGARGIIVGYAISTSRALIWLQPSGLTMGLYENGTAANPSISFDTDVDTGWYRIGANNIGLSTNGAVRWDIGASGQLAWTPAALSGTPSTTGSYFNIATATFTDNATAMSGTATAFVAYNLVAPTLAATNTSVTTTDAATFRVSAAPTAGTNETLTRSYSLWCDAGQLRVDSNVQVNNTAAFATTEPTAAAVFQSGTAPVGAITTGGAVFTSTTVMRKIIADGTASNIET